VTSAREKQSYRAICIGMQTEEANLSFDRHGSHRDPTVTFQGFRPSTTGGLGRAHVAP